MFSAFSEANSRVQPGRKILTSQDAGWTSLLFEKWVQPGHVAGFQTVASPDQILVLTASGTYELEVLSGNTWQRVRYGPGQGGATAPFQTHQIRWQSEGSSPVETLHIYVPPEYYSEAAEEYRRAGTCMTHSHINALSLSEPFVFSLAQSLVEGVSREVPDLYADAAARMFAVYSLVACGTLKKENLQRRVGHELTDRRLARVIDFMQHHFARQITLDQLADEAGISRFHFVRLFRKRLLTTPYQYLIGLRLAHAKVLLQTTDLDISAVASACGYTHAGRFATAFCAAFGLYPHHFRQQGRQ